MSRYLVTTKIQFTVEIDDTNASEPRLRLQGDSPEAAQKRAELYMLNRGRLNRGQLRPLGVKRTWVNTKDWEVTRLEDPE